MSFCFPITTPQQSCVCHAQSAGLSRWGPSLSLTCSPASTQSSSVHWKNLVFLSALSRYFFLVGFGGLWCRMLSTWFFNSFW
jgi:hypothetical protein